jgi:hypothetical protein
VEVDGRVPPVVVDGGGREETVVDVSSEAVERLLGGGGIARMVRGTVPPGSVVEVRMPGDSRPLLEFSIPAWSGPGRLECWVEDPLLALEPPPAPEAGAADGDDTAVEAGAGAGSSG